MLCVNQYPRAFVDACRRRVDRQLSSYDALVARVKDDAVIQAFEKDFFDNLVLALDNSFCHRSRGMEKKDGNPLNELRMLSNSIVDNGGVLREDRTIRYDPSRSILGFAVGDEIRLTRDEFASLSRAFLDEIERKYP